MDKSLLKEISTNSLIQEDIKLVGHNVPLKVHSHSGVYLCIDDSMSNAAAIDFYMKVKRRMVNNQLFLFKINEDGSGYFYDGHADFARMDDIYAAYRTCYDFSELYLSDGADNGVVALLYAVS